MRSSVIEAVSALEVAILNFGRNANSNLLLKTCDVNRIDINNINNQIDHLGFSGSIRYLIPVLIGEGDLPSYILKQCYKAIEVRNNVVHKGQRNVALDLVKEILNGVSFCCRVLDKYTNKKNT